MHVSSILRLYVLRYGWWPLRSHAIVTLSDLGSCFSVAIAYVPMEGGVGVSFSIMLCMLELYV